MARLKKEDEEIRRRASKAVEDWKRTLSAKERGDVRPGRWQDLKHHVEGCVSEVYDAVAAKGRLT